MNHSENKFKQLESRIMDYFGNGGLVNPEYMEHDKVRDLLMDILEAIRASKKRNMQMTLHDRINRVINTLAFEKSLETQGICLFDFQIAWASYETFNNLPETFQNAILAGEQELFQTTGLLV